MFKPIMDNIYDDCNWVNKPKDNRLIFIPNGAIYKNGIWSDKEFKECEDKIFNEFWGKALWGKDIDKLQNNG